MNKFHWKFWLVIFILMLLSLLAIKAILLPFVIGILTAYFLDPIADKLERLGLSRGVSTSIITIMFFGAMFVITMIFLPILYRQAISLFQEIPIYIDNFQQQYIPKINKLLTNFDKDGVSLAKEALSNASNNITNIIIKFIKSIIHSGNIAASALSLFVITPVVTFYLLRDWDKLVAKIDNLLPRKRADIIREQFLLIDQTLSSFIRGQSNVCLVLGIFYAIALTIAGLNFSIIIGLLAGILIIIPYIGTIFSGILAVGVAYMQFNELNKIIIIAAIFIFGQIIEGYFLTPKLVGEKVGLHPLWIIFAMMAGGVLFGFVGIFIAVPTAAVIGVLIRFAIKQYKISEYY